MVIDFGPREKARDLTWGTGDHLHWRRGFLETDPVPYSSTSLSQQEPK